MTFLEKVYLLILNIVIGTTGLSDEEILNILEQQKVETLAKMKGNGRK